jgi:REP element-mobilizing transposase RayT
MGRKPRINIEGGLYYVSSYGDGEKSLFRDEGDLAAFYGLIIKHKKKFNVKVYAYAFFPCEVNMLLKMAEGVKLSDFMHGLNSSYTKYHNAKYGETGNLFAGRYRSVIVEDERYLCPIVRLISNIKMLRPGDGEGGIYPVTSLGFFLGEGGDNLEMSVEKLEIDNRVKNIQGEEDKGLCTYIKEATREDLAREHRELMSQDILGSQDFRETVKKAAVEVKQKDQQSLKTPLGKDKWLYLSIALAISGLVIMAMVFFLNKKRYADIMEMLRIKQSEYQDKLEEQKESIRKDLNEKYSADRVSYEAMAKRLEIEKKKIEGLSK